MTLYITAQNKVIKTGIKLVQNYTNHSYYERESQLYHILNDPKY